MLLHTGWAIMLLAASTVALPYPVPEPAKLRRIPRIYNALITTDEELLPSQAYPAVAPVLRPAPIAHYPLQPAYQSQYGLYTPDPYGFQAYNLLPGFNDTLLDPEAPQRQAAPVYSLQPQQTVPQINDQVKNNRPGNRDIPDVPPPPLPVSPPRDRSDQEPERKPQNYPPAPPQGLPF